MADGEQQAKRARTGLAGGWQEAASQAAATLPGSPAAAVLDEEELEGSDSELKERIELLPCDTLVAMQVMENECRQQAPQFPWPVVLKSHLYSLVKDHAAVDKEIDDMRRRRVVRVFKVPIATDDYAVQLTEHYEKHVREVKHTLIEGGTPAETAAALDWFIDRVLPRWVEVSISHNDFVELLARPRHRSSSRCPGPVPMTLSFLPRCHQPCIVPEDPLVPSASPPPSPPPSMGKEPRLQPPCCAVSGHLKGNLS